MTILYLRMVVYMIILYFRILTLGAAVGKVSMTTPLLLRAWRPPRSKL